MEQKMPLSVTNITLRKATTKKAPAVLVRGREFFSLTYRESGSITIASERGGFTSGAGSITYIPRGLSYETEVAEEGVMYVLHVWTADAGAPFGDRPLTCRPVGGARFAEDFAKACARFEAEGLSFSCLSTVFRILSEAQNAFCPTTDQAPPQLRRAKAEMDARFADAAWRVGDYAALRGVSEVYFRREFRRFYGLSPLEYIRKKRVDAAMRMLQSGLYRVTDVALQAGFESVAYFSAAFRALVGLSPTEYVRSLEILSQNET